MIAAQYQNTLTDVIKLQCNTQGGNGPELARKLEQLRELAQQLSPEARTAIEGEAAKKAVNEMQGSNEFMMRKGNKPKYAMHQTF